MAIFIELPEDMRKKRYVFDELMEGFDALAEQRAGKRTLRTHAVKPKPVPEMSARELTKVREQMKLSRSLFAGVPTHHRAYAGSRGRPKANGQAALPIRLVQLYPDTIRRLAEI